MKSLTTITLSLLLIFLSVSCKKDSQPQVPVTSLHTGGIYTPAGSVIQTGRAIVFGITARAGDANLTNLVIRKEMPDGTTRVVLDSGMNSTGFTLNKTYYQGVEDTAKWVFQVMDKNRLFSSAFITLYRDPASQWGGILEYPQITLGYQDNSLHGHFLNCATGKVFQADSAGMSPDSIDIAAYFYMDDNLPSPTFSSPGEYGGAITEYYPYISGWQVKNYTLWDISVEANPIPVQSYNDCHNDSLLIVSYNDVWGKRKYKWADPGEVLPFLTARGKKGLIRVLSADQTSSGTITFSLKVQQ